MYRGLHSESVLLLLGRQLEALRGVFHHYASLDSLPENVAKRDREKQAVYEAAKYTPVVHALASRFKKKKRRE